MKFVITIDLDNGEYDEACQAIEVHRLLRIIAASLATRSLVHYTKTLWNSNGNPAGEARVVEGRAV